jgi:host factor-I protein
MTEAAAIYEVKNQEKRQETDIQGIMLRKFLGETVTVFLVNGMRMIGKLTAHDRFSIVIDNRLLVYKHAISTIQPGAPQSRFDREEKRERA